MAFVFLSASSVSLVYAQTTQMISTAPEMFVYIHENYDISGEPIAITEGTLTTSSGNQSVYLVSLTGTAIVANTATGIINDFEAGFDIEGAYVEDVKNAIFSYVPYGSKLVLAGHSLGGMVCQEIAADSDIKKYYNVINTVTFGSPLVGWLAREGVTQRLGDSSDVVPYLSVSSLFVVTLLWESLGLNVENGGYGDNLLAAHLDSYANVIEWTGWNAIGFKNETGYIVLNLSTRKQFRAPAGWIPFTY